MTAVCKAAGLMKIDLFAKLLVKEDARMKQEVGGRLSRVSSASALVSRGDHLLMKLSRRHSEHPVYAEDKDHDDRIS
jgi:hypothetical protein